MLSNPVRHFEKCQKAWSAARVIESSSTKFKSIFNDKGTVHKPTPKRHNIMANERWREKIFNLFIMASQLESSKFSVRSKKHGCENFSGLDKSQTGISRGLGQRILVWCS
ncbi:hypothetical protein AMECASPLE_026594 [Ameca splendens]|uniref:Uncharacterized protein n=1 Tax=Ameca splendens TaxID=208324 RepID=A0ABV1ACP5_9TELE